MCGGVHFSLLLLLLLLLLNIGFFLHVALLFALTPHPSAQCSFLQNNMWDPTRC